MDWLSLNARRTASMDLSGILLFPGETLDLTALDLSLQQAIWVDGLLLAEHTDNGCCSVATAVRECFLLMDQNAVRKNVPHTASQEYSPLTVCAFHQDGSSRLTDADGNTVEPLSLHNSSALTVQNTQSVPLLLRTDAEPVEDGVQITVLLDVDGSVDWEMYKLYTCTDFIAGLNLDDVGVDDDMLEILKINIPVVSKHSGRVSEQTDYRLVVELGTGERMYWNAENIPFIFNPVFGDLDRDGAQEMVVQYDYGGNDNGDTHVLKVEKGTLREVLTLLASPTEKELQTYHSTLLQGVTAHFSPAIHPTEHGPTLLIPEYHGSGDYLYYFIAWTGERYEVVAQFDEHPFAEE